MKTPPLRTEWWNAMNDQDMKLWHMRENHNKSEHREIVRKGVAKAIFYVRLAVHTRLLEITGDPILLKQTATIVGCKPAKLRSIVKHRRYSLTNPWRDPEAALRTVTICVILDVYGNVHIDKLELNLLFSDELLKKEAEAVEKRKRDTKSEIARQYLREYADRRQGLKRMDPDIRKALLDEPEFADLKKEVQ